MSIISTVNPVSAPRAPYKVDVSKGGHNGEVSKQWMARPSDQKFNTLRDLYEFKKNIAETSFESRVRNKDVEIVAPELIDLSEVAPHQKDAARLENARRLHELSAIVPVKSGGDVQRVREVSPTHWSFGQLCSLAKAPARYLRELPSSLVNDQLNYRLRHAREVEEIKLYGGESQLYAATGPEYGRIFDFEVVDAIRQIAGDGLGNDGFRWKAPGTLNWSNGTYDPEDIGGIEQRTFYASDRDMFVFLVDDRNPIEVGKLRDGSPDYVFRGFYMQNSEMGSRLMKLAAFYLRGVCMNRNLWGVEGFQEIEIRHTRLAPDRWLQEALPALRSFADGSQTKLVEGVKAAKEAKVAEDDDAAMDFLAKRNVSKGLAKRAMDLYLEEEGQPVRSAWDVAQAVTRVARDIPNNDERLDLEIEAKRVLDKVTGTGR